MIKFLPLFSLCLSGFLWGTTGIFVVHLTSAGFSSFELLTLRLTASFLALCVFVPAYTQWKKTPVNDTGLPSYSPESLTATLVVGALMFLYYLGSILALQNLPLVTAVLMFGASPALSWFVMLCMRAMKRSRPSRNEMLQGLGAVTSTIGLAYISFHRVGEQMAPAGANPITGYFGGAGCAFVTVLVAYTLKKIEPTKKPKPLNVTLTTSVLGVLAAPFILNAPGIWNRANENLVPIIGFGIVATLLPGVFFAYSSKELNPTTTSTVSVQIQIWTIVLGFLLFNQSLSQMQTILTLVIISGTVICVHYGNQPTFRGLKPTHK